MLRNPNGSADAGILAQRCARRFLAVVPRLMASVRGVFADPRLAGLTPARFRILAHLSAERDTSLSALARAMDLGLPTLSAMVEDLRRDGAVARAVDARDRRRSALRLTRRGHALFARAERIAAERLAVRFADLAGPDLRTVAAGLDRLHAACAARPGSQP